MSKKTFEPKYKVFTNNRNFVKVGCSYAGRMFYGTANCSPEDEFDYDIGYRLAKARCDFAICSAKLDRSHDKIEYYENMMNMFRKWLVDERDYEELLHSKWIDALDNLNNIYDIVCPLE